MFLVMRNTVLVILLNLFKHLNALLLKDKDFIQEMTFIMN